MTLKKASTSVAAAAKEEKLTYLDMVIQAIKAVKDRKGASRAAIANWIQDTHNKEGGGLFNSYLRTAIKKGIESGVFNLDKIRKNWSTPACSNIRYGRWSWW